jgi:hypothetical protein
VLWCLRLGEATGQHLLAPRPEPTLADGAAGSLAWGRPGPGAAARPTTSGPKFVLVRARLMALGWGVEYTGGVARVSMASSDSEFSGEFSPKVT